MPEFFSISVNCPLCKKSLMDNEHPLHDQPSIKLNIAGGGERGVIHLCSLYGCYDHKSEIDISKIDIAEFSCPHCNQLLTTKEMCETCGASMISFLMDVGGRVKICSRKGCKEHYVAFENVQDEMRKFYDEYGT
jgi:hypothetical protein